MTIAHIRHDAVGNSSTTGTLTVPVTAGTVLVAGVHIDCHTAAANRTSTVTDSDGNTWNRSMSSQSGQASHVQTTDLWWCSPTASNASLTITFTISGTNDAWEADVYQFSGVDTKFPFSDFPTATTNYTTTAAAITASQAVSRSAGGVAFAFATTNNATAQAALGTPTGFTGQGFTNGSLAAIYGAYEAVSASTVTCNFTSSTQVQWCIISTALQPPSAVSLDGSASNSSAAASSISASLTTTKTNDIVVACILSVGTTLRTVSTVTASGLTFTKRSSQSSTNADGKIVNMEVWWALAATALTAKSITATLSGSANDSVQLLVFGANGADVTSPWDANASLPDYTANNTNSFSGMTSTAFSTSSGDRLVFCFATNNGSSTMVPQSRIGNEPPLTLLANNNAGTYNAFAEYAPAANTLTSKTIQVGGGTAANWLMVVDALNASNPNNASGTITTSLTKASIAGVGAMYPKGTIAQALTKLSMSASGAMYPKGTISTALTKLSQTAQAKVSPTGTITTALTKASLNAHGTETFPGTIVTALTKVSQSLAGKASIKGTITTTLPQATIAAAGSVSPAGTIHTTLSRANQAATGVMAQGGTIVTRLRGISQSLSGGSSPTGTIQTSLRKIVSQGAGWVSAQGGIVTALDNEVGITMHAVTFEVFTGTIQMDLTGFAQSLQAREIFTGSIVTTLGPVAQSGTAEEQIIGTITTRLGNANGSVIANVIEAAVIIQGPIEMNLGGLDVTALGGLLGAPGAGKWYSWRQTDN